MDPRLLPINALETLLPKNNFK